ncbi:aspartyl protease [Caulobacter sp. Root1455]|uniref:TIGR02281 family clan AA aspartic protease n=1 Tax=unclassified Caulobacter TaxID=2648921 RepID=UPI0006F5AACF|nr:MULTISPECIES: TIGR02281 family clan AA aspartic protease [unclassified Caulobacter]KQY26416.1 aspartyl protease [Caulobacter sp. Root487D2Y]KQY91395.1 aspartyl protease [Caulobacter sp. Root1455]
MLKFATIAIVGALSAVGAAKAVVSLDDLRQPDLRGPAPAVAAVDDGAAQIVKAADGHFWAEAKVDGRAVRFLIDTGATAVALSQTDAKRLGIDTKALDYSYKVMTASGETRAASVKLASVSVAGAQVRDVEALVVEKGLETSLLGMTYLGRLSSFQATPRALVLRS